MAARGLSGAHLKPPQRGNFLVEPEVARASIKDTLMLIISWLAEPAQAPVLAEFFAKNVSPSYISHGEIQLGRAVDAQTWSPHLTELLAKEIHDGSATKPAVDGQVRSLVAHFDGQLVGLALVSFHEGTPGSFALVEDLVVDAAHRGLGLGAAIMSRIEQEALSRGCSRLFLESGFRNDGAHAFFKKLGFDACSVVMVKTLRELSGRK